MDADGQGLDGEEEGAHSCCRKEQQTRVDWQQGEVVDVKKEHEAGSKKKKDQAQRCPVTLEGGVKEGEGE